jgi:DUF1680 family protein
MKRRIPRRQFLKTAPAAGALVYAGTGHPVAFTEVGVSADAHPETELWGSKRAPRGDYPIRGKSHAEVELRRDAFWAPKVRTNAEVTIPFEVRKREGSEWGLRRGVLEAAMISLETHPDPRLTEQVERAVRRMVGEAAQLSNREFEIAATWYRSTGRRGLLDKAIRSAELLYADFEANDPPFSGGERDSLNCAQLYRITGDPRHLHLAKHYLDIRGRADSVGRSRHNQSHEHVLEQSEAVGHAVNCVTLMVSMADVGILAGEEEYLRAALRMWRDAVSRKMYVTGGVGTTGNEGFGEAYSLPNIDAYSETCAVLMFITLNHNLFLATGDSRYIDVMERGLYNNAACGVSVSGDHYFYVNRLASAGDGRDLRWQRASLECCPPNLVRFMARMPGYVYAQDSEDNLFVNLYVSSEVTFEMSRGQLGLSVDSEMPWGGTSSITISAEHETEAAIRLRIPGWSRNEVAPEGLYSYADTPDGQATVSVNGQIVPATPDEKGYVSVRRRWADGDVIEVVLPLQVRKVVADSRVTEDRGRFAVERGPVVYCIERPEARDGEVLELLFDDTAELQARTDPDFLGGAVLIDAAARSITDPSSPLERVTLIPYHLWANRGAGEMSVWLSREEYRLGDTGPAGGFIFLENPNHAADGWRYLEAAPFDQSGGAKWGCFRHEVPGARGTAVGTGKTNTADILAACDAPGSAARLCAGLVLNGVGGWFLPSTDELVLMYQNLRAQGLGNFRDAGIADNFTYWASSQSSADMAAHVDFPDLGRIHGDDKDFPRRVRAIRAL